MKIIQLEVVPSCRELKQLAEPYEILSENIKPQSMPLSTPTDKVPRENSLKKR